MKVIEADTASLKLLAALICYGEDEATYNDVLVAMKHMMPSTPNHAPRDVVVVSSELMHAFDLPSTKEGVDQLMAKKLSDIRQFVAAVDLGPEEKPVVVANFTGPRAEA